MAQFIWDSELSLQQHRGSEHKPHVHGENCTCTKTRFVCLISWKEPLPGLFQKEKEILTGKSSKWYLWHRKAEKILNLWEGPVQDE